MRIILATLLLIPLSLFAQDEDWEARYKASQKTEVYTPVPAYVAPGWEVGQAPADAIVLFDGTSLEHFQSAKEEGGAAPWTLTEHGSMMVKPGAGDIRTKQGFQDVQLHLEWKSPVDTSGLEGQARANSGVFFQGLYEVQILDNYRNGTYTNGQAGSIYKQHIPLVNPIRPTGEWNTYDIIFTAPRFNADGSVASKGHLTVLFNGVLVQNHAEIQGETVWIGGPEYRAHADTLPIKLQDHGNLVQYRNIWVREL